MSPLDMQLEKKIRRSKAYELTLKSPFFEKLIRVNLWFLMIVLLILIFVPWQQTAVGTGRVIAFLPGERVQEITTGVSGQIQKWYVTEGAYVTKDQLLAEIVDNDPDILARLESEKEAAEKRLKVAEIAVRNNEINLKRQRELFAEGIVSQRQVEVAEMDLAQSVSQRAAAQMELNRVLIRYSQQNRQKVLAPFNGIVQQILVGEGIRFLKPGDVIALITPDTENRVVEAKMKGKDLPFLKVGQLVRIQFDGWPILQISGLPELSVGTFKGRVKMIDPSDDGEGRFRILVEPSEDAIWPTPRLLRQGVKARVWVAMNRVPLWFEVWRTLFSLPPMDVPVLEEDEKSSKPVGGKVFK